MMDVGTTSSVYHSEESQNNDTYISFPLEIYSHTFISRERGDFAYGFTKYLLCHAQKKPTIHLLHFPI